MQRYVLKENNCERSTFDTVKELLDYVEFGWGSLVSYILAKKGFFLQGNLFLEIVEEGELC